MPLPLAAGDVRGREPSCFDAERSLDFAFSFVGESERSRGPKLLSFFFRSPGDPPVCFCVIRNAVRAGYGSLPSRLPSCSWLCTSAVSDVLNGFVPGNST